MDLNIKKIKKRIYEFDLSKCELQNGNEMIVYKGVSEFIKTFKKQNLDEGIIVMPFGYTKGLIYKSSNNGEFYNNPTWLPDIVPFGFNIYGLKKGSFYKLTVIGRTTGTNNLITNDRHILVHNESNELVINADLKDAVDNIENYGIFRAASNEVNLFFEIGKVYINNIIIDEVELSEKEEEETEDNDSVFGECNSELSAFGVFSLMAETDPSYNGRYIPIRKNQGRGLNLYFDKNTHEYLLERDNDDDSIGAPFTNANYIIEINLNKLVYNNIDHYAITNINYDISTNTLKQGSIKFNFIDAEGKQVDCEDRDGRIVIIVRKLF